VHAVRGQFVRLIGPEEAERLPPGSARVVHARQWPGEHFQGRAVAVG